MPVGVYVPGGALNVTFNDATTKGAYMPDGSLRVTDVAGAGLYDASGALRVVSNVGIGVYATRADQIRYSDASSDSATGVQFKDGSLRLMSQAPSNAYVTEDGLIDYVAEDGTTFYVQET